MLSWWRPLNGTYDVFQILFEFVRNVENEHVPVTEDKQSYFLHNQYQLLQ